jgi:hypothetical protein
MISAQIEIGRNSKLRFVNPAKRVSSNIVLKYKNICIMTT